MRGSFRKLTLRMYMSVQLWKQEFLDKGIPEQIVAQYLPYIDKLLSKNLPVIFELEHLTKLVDSDIKTISKMVNSPSKFYRCFSIPKRRGGYREISAPYPTLLNIQKWIYENILLKLEVHDSAHGFIKHRSIISNAENHLSKKCILKIDLENFFPSIPINWVVNLFASLGYARNVSFYLASLCCLRNGLAQGAPTSPYLSNILIRNLDHRLKNFATKYELQYTRYADDIVFSGEFIPESIINVIYKIIEKYGLKVNKTKTTLIIGDKQKIITGLSVSGDALKIPRKLKREIKQEVNFIKRFGFLSHASHLKISDPRYLSRLIGRLNFWLQVEPNSTFAATSISFLQSINNEY